MKKNLFKIIGWDVDTQRGFMETKETTGYQGQLALLDNNYQTKGAMEIAPTLGKLTKYLRENNIPIFGSVDWHNKNSKEFSNNPDFTNTFPPHCIKNTYDAENIDATKKLNPMYIDWDREYSFDNLVNKIKSHNGEVVFRKDNFNVFQEVETPTKGVGNPYAKKIIKALNIEKAIVYGVATEVCVNYAVQGLKALNIEVYTITDAMQGVTPKSHEDQVKIWREEGIKIITLEELIKRGIK